MNTIDKYSDEAVLTAFLTRDFSQVGYEFVDDVITSLKGYAFAGITDLTTLGLPNITQIPAYAFYGASVSGEVDIPWSSITSIDSHAFWDSNIIKGPLTLPLLTNLGGGAFAGASGLSAFSAPLLNTVGLDEELGIFEGSSIQSFSADILKDSDIASRGFADCASLTTVNLPEQEYAGRYMFYHCSSLVNLNMPKLKYARSYSTFEGCSSLEEVNFPLLTEVSSSYLFKGCSALHTISLPEATGTVSGGFCEDCISLTSVNLPKVTRLMSTCFEGCTSLTAVSIPLVTYLGTACFRECTALTGFSHAGITGIAASCFEGCTNLEEVDLPVVASIGNSAFRNCLNLQRITLGGEITSLGSTVFEYDVYLEAVIFSGVTTVPSINSTTFMYASKIHDRTGAIYVPDQLLSSFQADSLWGQYNIKGISEL